MEDAQNTTDPQAQEPAEAAAPQPDSSQETEDSGGGPEVGVLVRLKALPQAVYDYIVSDDLAKTHQAIYDKYGLNQAERDAVYYAELQTFLQEIELKAFPGELWTRLGWDESKDEQVIALATDIAGSVFLPAQAHLGDAAGLVTELGGDIKSFPEKQLEVRRITYAQGAAEIAEVADLEEDEDGAMRKRLAFIIESRLRQVRTDVGMKEMLMRGKKTGGMDLSEAEADRIIGLLQSKTRMTTYADMPGNDGGAAAAAEAESEYTAEDIKKLYAGTAEEQEALGKRIERLASATSGDPAKMRDAFYQVVAPADGSPVDPLYVVAGLIAMSDGDKIADALAEDERFRTFIREYLKSKNREGEIAAFEADPTDAQYVNILLQYLLRGVAGYDDADSARLALHAITLLNKQGYNRYADLVAFDMNEGEFRWKDLVEP